MLTQDSRRIAVTTPLGSDELIIYQASLVEELSSPFLFTLELLSANDAIRHEKLLGEHISVRLDIEEGERYFDGVVIEFEQLGNKEGLNHYRAVLAPWLWLLKLSENCRIFQEKSYPEIIEQVFNDLGFSDFELKLKNNYAKVEYTVQFNESDFNFVSRLMEQEGIFYYFTHEQGKHKLILSDDSVSLTKNGELVYNPPSEHEQRVEPNTITHWHNGKQLTSSGVRLTDYDCDAPTKNLEAFTSDPMTNSLSSIERYRYPGKYKERNKGTGYTRMLMERENARFEVKTGISEFEEIEVGAIYTLQDHYRSDQNADYLVIKSVYELAAQSYFTAAQEGDNQEVTCQFTAIPSKVSFRPAARAIKPVVTGPQTAVVVGKKGEEIWTDKLGRIKVSFHWDKEGQSDENSSCWIRVSQNWAGKSWGTIQIPRIGQEVLVEYLHGDPDQPIVTGCVYNGSNQPPYKLPADATISGVKSRTTKGGAGYNEISLNDKKDAEAIVIHGQKDLQINILNDTTEDVGNDKTMTIKGNESLVIKGTQTEKVEKDVTQTFGAAQTVKVEKDVKETYGASHTLKVEKDVSEKVGGKHSLKVDKDCAIDAKNITLKATTKIELKVGGSSITIESSGITIKSSGDVTLDGTQVNAKGKAALNAEASGIVKVKGSMVKIN